jgi:hypothetical protein
MNKTTGIIVWLVLACGIAGNIGSVNIPKFWRQSKHEVRGTGVVTEVTAGLHRPLVCYLYTVGNGTFSGQDQSDAPNPPAEKLCVGDPVVVFYDPAKPSSSTLSDPHGLLTKEIIFAGLAGTVFSTLLVFPIWWRTRRRKQQTNATTAAGVTR